MDDYGQPLQFGYFLTPQAGTRLIPIAQDADRLGLDLIGIQDHPYQRRYVDAFTLMSAVLTATSRIRVFPDVANLPLRPPAMIAKALASMDVLSGGRAELGLGAGGYWDAIEAYGGPRRRPAVARTALEEAVHVIRLLWGTQRGLRFEGRHYRLAGAQPGPAPAHPIGIWLGVGGPLALSLTGRVADGWVPSTLFMTPDKLAEANQRIDDAAAAMGREATDIRRIYNVFGSIDEGGTGEFLNGPVRQWVDQLTELAVECGMDTFVFAGDPAQMPIFAREVAPAVREHVAKERA